MTEFPLSISFTDFEPSDAVSYTIRERADKLAEQFNRIISCRVFISRPSHRTRQKMYNIRIHALVPGKDFEANRKSSDMNGDIKTAIHAAFDHITRELRDYVVRRRELRRKWARTDAVLEPIPQVQAYAENDF